MIFLQDVFEYVLEAVGSPFFSILKRVVLYSALVRIVGPDGKGVRLGF